MKSFITKLEDALSNNDRSGAFLLVEKWLDSNNKILTFYEEVIPSILNKIDCAEDDYACVWLEHQMSGIVRGLVEMTSLYVSKWACKLAPQPHVLIACPKDETHELGAVVGANMFAYFGFKTTYVGADTPRETLEIALQAMDVDYLVLSVTNAYNLLELKKVVETLRSQHPNLKIFGAGRGVLRNRSKMALDGVIENSASITQLIESEGLTCSH